MFNKIANLEAKKIKVASLKIPGISDSSTLGKILYYDLKNLPQDVINQTAPMLGAVTGGLGGAFLGTGAGAGLGYAAGKSLPHLSNLPEQASGLINNANDVLNEVKNTTQKINEGYDSYLKPAAKILPYAVALPTLAYVGNKIHSAYRIAKNIENLNDTIQNKSHFVYNHFQPIHEELLNLNQTANDLHEYYKHQQKTNLMRNISLGVLGGAGTAVGAYAVNQAIHNREEAKKNNPNITTRV